MRSYRSPELVEACEDAGRALLGDDRCVDVVAQFVGRVAHAVYLPPLRMGGHREDMLADAARQLDDFCRCYARVPDIHVEQMAFVTNRAMPHDKFRRTLVKQAILLSAARRKLQTTLWAAGGGFEAATLQMWSDKVERLYVEAVDELPSALAVTDVIDLRIESTATPSAS